MTNRTVSRLLSVSTRARVGLIGIWLAGVLFNVPYAVNGINVTSILVAFAGAVVLLAVARMFQGRRGRRWLHR
jgi:uncharacterized membrane protein YeaQ/YmgE (transglycosylase-associated protein family)